MLYFNYICNETLLVCSLVFNFFFLASNVHNFNSSTQAMHLDICGYCRHLQDAEYNCYLLQHTECNSSFSNKCDVSLYCNDIHDEGTDGRKESPVQTKVTPKVFCRIKSAEWGIQVIFKSMMRWKGIFFFFWFNFIKVSQRWRIGCSTCILAIYFIFVLRDGDKCYWPTKIL